MKSKVSNKIMIPRIGEDVPMIVKHENIPPSSIIMTGFTSTKIIDLVSFYCCAKVQLKESYKAGDAMSIRWKDCVKGRPGGCFNSNSAMFDVNYNGKHKHAKPSLNSKMISLCGVKSEKEGEEVTRLVVDYVLDAQAYLESTRNEKFTKAMNWLLNICKGRKKECTKYITRNKKGVGCIEICKDVIDYTLDWPLVESYPPKYKDIIQEFLTRTDDLIQKSDCMYSELEGRIRTFADLGDIFEEEYYFTEMKVSSYIYYYDLGFLPNRKKLNAFLKSRGCDSDYSDNWGNYIKVLMETKEGLNVSKLHRKDVSGKQTFTFCPRGKVRHNGACRESMAICYEKIMNTIAEEVPQLTI